MHDTITLMMMKMFLLILVSFVVLMSPYRMIMFAASIFSLAGGRLSGWSVLYQEIFFGFTAILYVSNSIANPLLFNIMAKRFRMKVVGLSRKLFVSMRKPAIMLDGNTNNSVNGCPTRRTVSNISQGSYAIRNSYPHINTNNNNKNSKHRGSYRESIQLSCHNV
ncbi:uncharacterized protein LOC142353272 [Convolutriloba macropyga]|uniref:uncharacterized protein LOC142353272 n=1 Tax=Convolutriloba macropyga TaxID=536237 RepID=UPI003F5269FD